MEYHIEREPKPVLYILMRTDLQSLNPGKAMAQAAHAANAFVDSVIQRQSVPEYFYRWQESTSQGFGTVVVLGCDAKQLTCITNIADTIGLSSGVVNDPTYPLQDGKVTHYIPLCTCGWVFGDSRDLSIRGLLGNLELHS